ncbi:MAG: tRNA adenosine(34) deaminase TadA [Firmicutes bacterium]|nr:tRNA adenosine(34) deaminase TadA [Dethiobacter sp.]MBS3889805.1 tRNA adenosine(34) deaminase TadA [Bacillota bacterium]
MNHEYFMREALVEARLAYELGETPVGAVVVRHNLVIARGHNFRENGLDPTAHAEVLALRHASQVLGGWRLLDCTLYVTLEPCLMCAGAMVLARLPHLVFGAHDPKAGVVGSVMNVLRDNKFNHQVAVVDGVLAEECGSLLKDFFSNLRQRK